MFAPSPRQQAIFAAVSESVDAGTRNSILVNAVAGSGKTTTILRALHQLPAGKKKLFLAFNTSAVAEAEERARALGIENLTVQTMNAAGHRLVMKRMGKVFLNAKKTQDVFAKIRDEDHRKYESAIDAGEKAYRPTYPDDMPRVYQLVELAKAHGIVPGDKRPGLMPDNDATWKLISGRDEPQMIIRLVRRILAFGSSNKNNIDFNDQCFYPFYYDLRDESYDVVAVDEAQDLTVVQQNLASRFVKPNGTMIFVGDRAQAIYGFRGADTSSMDNILRMYGCTEFPLDVSYRCPRSVVIEAQRYNPVIQSHEAAPEGTVETVGQIMADHFKNGHMVICRNRAPLLRLAFKLIAAYKTVKISADVVASVMRVLREAEKKSKDLAKGLELWLAEQDAETDLGKASVADMYECCADLIKKFGRLKDIRYHLESLDGKKEHAEDCISLMTIHRAKGLEAGTVWILNRDLMPSKMAKHDWELDQEKNLAYVAVTRAQQRLVFVELENVGESRLQRFSREEVIMEAAE